MYFLKSLLNLTLFQSYCSSAGQLRRTLISCS
uniref:Uncharacterized protein n=1 Tax=Arundo donax TaxID=35708 RepID=A0A0A9SSB2_ARUDO